MTKKEYELRLQTKEWKEFSNSCKLKMDNRCQMCGHQTFDNSKLHLHHMSYSLVDEENEYKVLILLCEDCHETFHKNSKAATKSCDRNYLQLHLAKVLMRAGRDVSYFLDSGSSLNLKWELFPLKLKGVQKPYEEKKLEASNWTPEKVKRDLVFINRILDGETIPDEIIIETLGIPDYPRPKKWRKKLLKHLTNYSYKYRL
jgi:hypothetical protein